MLSCPGLDKIMTWDASGAIRKSVSSKASNRARSGNGTGTKASFHVTEEGQINYDHISDGTDSSSGSIDSVNMRVISTYVYQHATIAVVSPQRRHSHGGLDHGRGNDLLR